MLQCTKCGEVKPAEQFLKGRKVCKACKQKYKQRLRDEYLDRLDEQFNEWLEKIRSVPKDYPSLTEAQWIEACNRFGGCARCGSEDIDSRGFFVGAQLGGRYCDWNVIPVCEKCATSWDLINSSAFRYIEKRAYNDKNLNYKKCLANIVEYLGGKLDNATNKKETE